jgi:hypothetical protein
MKKFIWAMALCFACVNFAQADVISTTDFESAGGFTTSTPEFSDGGSDYFIRTDGSDHSTFNVYNSPQGSFYFAANDIDGEGASETQTLNIDGINVANFTNLNVDFLLAEDDDGDDQDWDVGDSFTVWASIDGGADFQIFGVEDQGATNTEPLVDTDFDGLGDGAAITDVFTGFNAAISGTGSTLDLEFIFSFNSGDEDIAIDNIVVNGTNAVPEPATAVLFGLAGLGLCVVRRR